MEGIVRGYKAGLLTQNQYNNLTQCETIEGARGELGDYRPLRALAQAVKEFRPDQLVICTHPEDRSTWLRYDVVDRARESYPDVPVTHVVVSAADVSV